MLCVSLNWLQIKCHWLPNLLLMHSWIPRSNVSDFCISQNEKENNIKDETRFKISILSCCVFWPANACLGMRSHGQKQWKTFKIMKKVPFPLCVREAHVGDIKNEEKSLWALHEPLVRILEKVLFDDFLMFFIIFAPANACASMRSLVKIHNTQLTKTLFLPKINKPCPGLNN